jgi:hypothetical protein
MNGVQDYRMVDDDVGLVDDEQHRRLPEITLLGFQPVLMPASVQEMAPPKGGIPIAGIGSFFLSPSSKRLGR